MAEAHLRLVNISKSFSSEAAAVDGISLDVPRGSFTTILGPSGCGKTTTLRMIAGFYEPDQGDILLSGRRINAVPAHRRNTAMVFQDYALFPHMSVEENVGYGLRLARMPKEEARERVNDTLGFLGLERLGKRMPNQLSGGQQQRVALARALVMKPEVLLLDEPLSNLDAKLRVQVRAELTGIQRQLGLTTIYVTHDQDEALAMSDWIAVMNQGRVIQWGTPWEVYYQPRTAFMAEFVGAVNLVPAEVIGQDGEQLRVRLEGHDLEVPSPSHPHRDERGTVLLCIRPETLQLGEGPAGGLCALAGSVRQRTFLGAVMRYTVAVGDRDWLVDVPDPGGCPEVGGQVSVLVNPARVHVVPEV
ncbi:MAG TPA: ABC transporter ATP-binding protein [Chloroflexota bacterium]|nr:ABC transporter ATP-binding protein [Chloroflexota bacterium]